MTDEQVQRIVDALAGNPWEPALTVAIALVSVVLGFGLSQLAEWAGRRRARREHQAERRTAAVTGAIEETLSLASKEPTGPDKIDLAPGVVRSVAAFHELGDGGRKISFWWIRQLNRLSTPPASDADASEEHRARVRLGALVVLVLQSWAKGEATDGMLDESFDDVLLTLTKATGATGA